MVSKDDIEAAARRIRAHVRRTPVLALEAGAFGLPASLSLKLELLQHAGSFKARGAFNNLLSRDVPDSGLIAASGGNHGAAIAHAARSLGHEAEIFVPSLASPAKIKRIAELGGQVTIVPGTYADALIAADARQKQTGALSIHAYDAVETIAGQGSLAFELDAQLADIDTILVAVGGGGLIAGIAAWFRGRVNVVGVEPLQCPTLQQAFAKRRPVDVEVGGVAADSLGARRIGNLPFAIAKDFVEGVVLVEDAAILEAQALLWRDLRLAAEPGGAASLAALISGAYRPRVGEKIVVLVCGGNVDPASLGT